MSPVRFTTFRRLRIFVLGAFSLALAFGSGLVVRGWSSAGPASNSVGTLTPATAQLRRGAVPVVLYQSGSFLTGRNGFPNLLVYTDGTVLKATPSRDGRPPSTADMFRVPAEAVVRLLTDLDSTGLFATDHVEVIGSGYDLEGQYIEATRGDRRVVAFLYGQRDDIPVTKTLAEAVEKLRSFSNSLEGAVSYLPPGLHLHFAAVGSQSDPPGAPLDPGTARRWPLADTDLTKLTESGRDWVALPPSAAASLSAIAPAYTASLVRLSDGGFYVVQWRPLYWNE